MVSREPPAEEPAGGDTLDTPGEGRHWISGTVVIPVTAMVTIVVLLRKDGESTIVWKGERALYIKNYGDSDEIYGDERGYAYV